MKAKYIIPALAACFFATGCSTIEPETPSHVEKHTVILSADCSTKTSLAPETDGSRPVLWKAGDMLGLFVNEEGAAMADAQNVVARLCEGSGSGHGYSNGSFAVDLAISASKTYDLCIYYPYIATAGSVAEISHRIPAIQTQPSDSDSRHLGNSGAFAYAEAQFTTPSNMDYYDTPVVNFTMQHKTSTIHLSLTSADMAGWKVKSATVSAPQGVYIAGDMKYTPENDQLTLTGNMSESITLNVPAGASLAADAAVDLYLVAFPTAIAGKELLITYTLEAADASSVKVVTHARTVKTDSKALAAGTVHVFNEVLPAADGEGWTYSTSDTFDLSAGGTANCYIVSVPGKYSFDATVIGNGQKGILTPVSTTFFHTETATIAPTQASLLWQTAPGLIKSVSFENGRIIFEKSADVEYGNALIAAKNASGTILWSWHIWCTEMGDLLTYVSPTGTYEGMDRNLGATFAASAKVTGEEQLKRTVGMFYQWGRKDPFVGPMVFDSGRTSKDIDLMYDIDGNTVTRPTAPAASKSAGQSIQYTIKNPKTPIYTGNSTSGDWFALSSPMSGGGPAVRAYYLWGNPVGYKYDSSSKPTPVKTIYDPCPVGYMVPTMDFYNSFKKVSSTSNLGFVMNVDGGSTQTWLPIASAMSSKSSAWNWVGDGIGYIWTSSYGSASGTAARSIRMGYTGFNGLNNGYGFNVRCIQETH